MGGALAAPALRERARASGQAFNFDLLEADFDAAQFRRDRRPTTSSSPRESGSSTTWVLSNHDVVRHATRYGLPHPSATPTAADAQARQRVAAVAAAAARCSTASSARRRARAATLFVLGLPGSAYLYQGEELGLHEVAEHRRRRAAGPDVLPQPRRRRRAATDAACRCRGRSDGTSFGFGADGAHLPQPAWFAELAVEAQEDDPASTLALYRRALAVRRALQGPERLEWQATEREDVVRFRRDGAWEVVINFGDSPAPMPAGEVLVASGPVRNGVLPGETAAWLRVSPQA